MNSSVTSAERTPRQDAPPDQSPEWKQEANHRLAAHRARRSGRFNLQAALPGMEAALPEIQNSAEQAGISGAAPQAKSQSVADRVAARYAKAPTYSEILAAEARNAARAAEAAAIAAGEARDAAQAILVGLDADRDEERRGDIEAGRKPSQWQHREAPSPLSSARKQELAAQSVGSKSVMIEAVEEPDHAWPEEPAAPVQPLPAKLLEFPRELVATRKARPRLAEGPLREEFDRGVERSQLRIFEVEHEAISTDPVVEPVLPIWSSIRLGSSPDAHYDAHRDWLIAGPQPKTPESAPMVQTGSPSQNFDLPLQTASLEDRIMAAIFDAAVIVAGFLVFILVFAACTVHPPTGKPAVIGAGLALLAFTVIYLLLFFNFGQDTPGMRYAKIALCTFDDENPTRRTMRRRLGALLLAVSPLGLGILWAFFDDDRLGWHDRISRTYQRSYR